MVKPSKAIVDMDDPDHRWFFEPDSTVSSPLVLVIVTKMNRYSWRRAWKEGFDFAFMLSQEKLSDYDVALAMITFSSDRGCSSLASTYLELTRVDFQTLTDKSLLEDVRLARLYLHFAFLKIHRELNSKDALAILKRVENLYWPDDSQGSSADSSIKDLISETHRNALWLSGNPIGFKDSFKTITDHRVGLEQEILLLYKAILRAGYITPELVAAKINKRIPTLIKYLRAQKRLRTEANLLFAFFGSESDLHQSSAEAITFWQEYIERLVPEYPSSLTSRALNQMAVLLLDDREMSETYFHVAIDTLKEEPCANGITHIEISRIKFLLAKTHSAADRFALMEPIFRQLFNDIDLLGLIECVKLTLDIAGEETHLFSRVMDIVKELVVVLRSAENNYGIYCLEVRYHTYASTMVAYAEESRRFFETFLDEHHQDRDPDSFAVACKLACIANITLNQYQHAFGFAEREYSSPIANLIIFRKSDAATRIAACKEGLLAAALYSRIIGPLPEPEENQIISQANELVDFLKGWIESDQKLGYRTQRRQKEKIIITIYRRISMRFQRKNDLEQWEFWLKLHSVDSSKPVSLDALDLDRIEHLSITHKEPAEATSLATKMFRNTLNNPTASMEDKEKSRLFLVKMIENVIMQQKVHTEIIRNLRYTQYNMLALSLTLGEAYQTGQLFLERAPLLSLVIAACMQFWPEQRAQILSGLSFYFEQAEKVIRQARYKLQQKSDLNTWLMKRQFSSSSLFFGVISSAVQIYLDIGEAELAWYWVQRGRGQSLLEMLHGRQSSVTKLGLAFQGNERIRLQLATDEKLTSQVTNSTAIDQKSAAKDLESHRSKMRQIPALRELLEGTEDVERVYYDKLDDIWELAKDIPTGRDIVLIDWVVTPNGIWRINVNYKDRTLKPRCKKLKITVKYIQSWILAYMKFPTGELAPLEKDLKALHKLQNLTDGLESVCKPDDLLILCLPRELMGLPIHAVPFDGTPGTVWIRRNPIIYGSSVGLYRECLRRAKISSPKGGSSLLQGACFTAAYEEQGHEAERENVFKLMQRTAASFGARSYLGSALTSETFKGALCTSGWVHYHGHAFFSHSEALDQAFVLSELQEDEKRQQSRNAAVFSLEEKNASEPVTSDGEKLISVPNQASVAGSSQFENLKAGLTVENSDLKENSSAAEAKPKDFQNNILAACLLKDSSRVSVAEIFALDLSNTYPVVCSIACDSGVQDVSKGDEPLGLVSALFCAGASSVVGTLWPIQSSTGRVFTEAFYQNLQEQEEVRRDKETLDVRDVLDLADALRNATLKVLSKKKDPYSWAAFILQGAGFCFY